MKAKFDVIPHLEDLWRYGRVLTGNDSDADDLVQEALARALSMAGGYDPSRPLLPWLILLNEKVRDRALALDPEIATEGGDPSKLPLLVRQTILAEIVARIIAGSDA